MRFKTCKNKGITLIALVITIIVMLILVGVTINLAIQGGLFDTARGAVKDTEIEGDKETLQGAVVGALNVQTGVVEKEKLTKNLPDWKIQGEGLYTCISPNENVFKVDIKGNIKIAIELPEGWTEIAKPLEWDNDKIVAVTDGTNTIPLPEGYEISKEAGENTVAEGLVIKDSKGNQFVWIPIAGDFANPYSYASSYSEPREVTANDSSSGAPYDSQETLNYYYGTKEDGSTSFYDYVAEFAYSTHYAEMVESVNKYNGFYIGRYETTVDENNKVGSKGNNVVLTADKRIPQTNNKSCRWWGLYNAQRNSNVVGNKDYVQTNMIWGQQWEAMLKFLGDEQANSKIEGSQSKVLKSGEATYDNGLKDEMNNIYDLRRNGWDCTAETYGAYNRVLRGSSHNNSYSASNRLSNLYPSIANSYFAARFTLYIR